MRPPVSLVHSHFTFTSCEIHHCGWQFMMSCLIRCQDHIISSTDFIWNDSSHYSAVYDVNEVNVRILCSHFQWQSMTHPCFMVTQCHYQSSRQFSVVDNSLLDSGWQNPLHSVVDDRLDGELVPRVTREEPEDRVTSSANLRKRNQLWLGASCKITRKSERFSSTLPNEVKIENIVLQSVIKFFSPLPEEQVLVSSVWRDLASLLVQPGQW